ncbi:hypothetical protein M407DRAFT_29235 [Tulasnella calospora MUT 4182]|uniref:BTB domain-containing protein n=1 Tax=Tulasnella calospora MUT 4182 TaxID=1051891 RepID=A0A0C3LI60_9AGAM|nr:hypothetical protein M407DRAFT_29235 [Tulasnella calospora MUT 4182]
MPPGTSQQPHGLTDNLPISLPPSTVSLRAFELLLMWLYREGDVPSSLDDAITLLYLGDYLDVPELMKNMSHYITELPAHALRPARRIFFHRRFQFGSAAWLRDSFLEILRGSLCQLTVEDLADLGYPTVRELIKTFQPLDRHRTKIAIQPPPAVHEPDCHYPEECGAAWLQYWSTEIAPLLTASVNPMSGSDVLGNTC